MRIGTNLVFDKPNKNGRIYKKEMFIDQLKDYLEGEYPVIYSDSSSCVNGDLFGICARIMDYDFEGDTLFFDVHFMSGLVPEIKKELCEVNAIEVTSAGYSTGIIEGEVQNYKLKGFYTIPKD